MARLAPLSPLLTLLLTMPALAAERDDADKAIARALEVQNALSQGRQHLARSEAKQAVAVLEAKLPYIDGNRNYLAALREAYQAYAKELQRTQQTAEIERVMARLRLLDPSAKLDGIAATAAPAKQNPDLKARAQADDNDPFQQTPLANKEPGPELARQAEVAFQQERYADAEKLFERASAADASSVRLVRGDWAYCILHRCNIRLQQPSLDGAAREAIERDIRVALAMAVREPKLQDFGNQLLQRLRASGGAAATDSWSVTELANFRLFHHQSNELAERVLKQAEKSRLDAVGKWFGGEPSAWTARCDIYLHANSGEYVRAVKGLPQAHGHSTIETKEGKVVGRRIDLVADNPNLLCAAVPRELTHVVLADVFSAPLLPRWADEAMAILAEPRPNVERYLHTVDRYRRDNQLFAVGQLMTAADFPDAAAITPFYVQSVSLVDMLVNERGSRAFAIFLQDARRYGYEKALERNYQIRGFADLQQRWQRLAFAAAMH